MDICTVNTKTVHNKVIAGKRDSLMWADYVIKVKDNNSLRVIKDLSSQLQRQNIDVKGS